MKDFLNYAVPILCAGIAFWGARQARENQQLRTKLKRALSECQRFYDLEELYCEKVVEMSWHKTILAAKRWVRALQRARGNETPSITPQEVARGLEKL